MAINTERVGKAMCEMIDLIASKRVEDAGYDKTIPATIIECTDSTIGKYKVKYQDSIFYAYSDNINVTYSKNAEVYVSVPNGDMDRDKHIIGTVEKLGINYIPVIEDGEKYKPTTGQNLIEIKKDYSLCSYRTEERAIYPTYNAQGEQEDFFIGDKEGKNGVLKENFKNADSFMIGASIKTNLPQEQQFQGHYGIKIILVFKDEQDSSSEIEQTFSFSSTDMSGMPYNFIVPIEKKKFFDIDGKRFDRVKKISLFVRDFPKEGGEEKPSDIFFSNLQFLPTDKLSNDELNYQSLNFQALEGTIFFKDIPEQKLKVTAQVLIKGKVVNASEQKIAFYWFKKDGSIQDITEGYSPIGGIGWKCLNPKQGTEPSQMEYVPMGADYVFEQSNNIAEHNLYKCVAKYQDIFISNTIDIRNYASKYKAEIISDNGLEFYNTPTSFSLSCIIQSESEEVKNAKYYWTMINDKGELFNVPTIENNSSVTKPIDVMTIIGKAKYECTVKNLAKQIIASASVVITNTKETEKQFHLIIKNGDQIFKYDENGLSPTNDSFDRPLVIKPLSFTLLDPDNREIQSDLLKIEWRIPTENTLLEPLSKMQEKDFLYKIKPHYNKNYNNNNIELVVQYKDKVLTATTNFTFLKEGDSGTNGTQYACRIVPNNDVYKPDHIILTYQADGGGYKFNYTHPAEVPFKAELWKNGIKEDLLSDKEKWSVLSIQEDKTQCTMKGNKFSFNSSGEDTINIIQLGVKIDGERTIFTSAPIITIKDYSKQKYTFNIKNRSGFKYVTYNSKGANPRYDATEPFKIEINNGNVDSNNFTFEWKLSKIDNLSLSDVKGTIARVEPSDTFNKFVLDNTVICNVFENSSLIAEIRIPIHMFLNRYENADINNWDGNTIKIGKESKSLLSPMLGAGTKESDNSFTGVVMGTEISESKTDIGLMSYYKGARTTFLDAKTGKFYCNSGEIATSLLVGSIDASKIAVTNLNANNITSGTLSCDYLSGGKIVGQTIEGGSISGAQIDADSFVVKNQLTIQDPSRKWNVAFLEGEQIAMNSFGLKITTAQIILDTYYSTIANTLEAKSISSQKIAAADSTGKISLDTSNLIFSKSESNIIFQKGLSRISFSDGNYITTENNKLLLSNSVSIRNSLFLETVASEGGRETNCFIDDNGQIKKTNGHFSSIKYKQDVTNNIDPELNPHKLYDINIVQYKYKEPYQTPKDDIHYNRKLVGFIAEDIYKKYPNGARGYYKKDQLNIESWDSFYLIPPMLKLIQEQHEDIEKLKQQVNKLSANK